MIETFANLLMFPIGAVAIWAMLRSARTSILHPQYDSRLLLAHSTTVAFVASLIAFHFFGDGTWWLGVISLALLCIPAALIRRTRRLQALTDEDRILLAHLIEQHERRQP